MNQIVTGGLPVKLDRVMDFPKQKKRERRMEIDKVKKIARQQHEEKRYDNKGDGNLLRSLLSKKD